MGKISKETPSLLRSNSSSFDALFLSGHHQRGRVNHSIPHCSPRRREYRQNLIFWLLRFAAGSNFTVQALAWESLRYGAEYRCSLTYYCQTWQPPSVAAHQGAMVVKRGGSTVLAL